MPAPRSSRPDIFTRYGLTRLINASGTETTMGASPVCPEVLEAVHALVPHSVSMLELQSLACRVIAEAFATEAGIVVNCSAAGIAMAVAGCMTGDDLDRAEKLPDVSGLKHEVILMRGHNINYGGPIAQNIAIAGGKMIEIGAATECAAVHLAGAITPATAAALYVVSHHTVPSGLIDLKTFCRICHRQGVPVIVDAAAEPDPRLFLRAGADLVITSMHKQFASLTGGTVAGRLDLVRACLLQKKGIGRPMKVGKESVIAAIAAIQRWSAQDRRAVSAALMGRLARGQARLSRLRGITAEIELDGTSRLFSRLLLKVDPAKAGLSAADLAARLLDQRPAIAVRALMAELGELRIDLRRASDETADQIFAGIKQAVAKRGRSAAGGRKPASRRFPLALKRGAGSRTAAS